MMSTSKETTPLAEALSLNQITEGGIPAAPDVTDATRPSSFGASRVSGATSSNISFRALESTVEALVEEGDKLRCNDKSTLEAPVVFLASSRDSRLVAAALSNGSVACLDVVSGPKLSLRWTLRGVHSHDGSHGGEYAARSKNAASSHGPVRSLQFSSDSHTLLMVDSSRGKLHLYDARCTGEPVDLATNAEGLFHDLVVTAASWAPSVRGSDVERLVTGSVDGTVRVLEYVSSTGALLLLQSSLSHPMLGGDDDGKWTCTHLDWFAPNSLAAGFCRVVREGADDDGEEDDEDDMATHEANLLVAHMQSDGDASSWDELGDVSAFFSVPRRGRHVFYTAYLNLDTSPLLLVGCNVSSDIGVVSFDGSAKWEVIDLQEGSSASAPVNHDDEYTFPAGITTTSSGQNASFLLGSTDGSVTLFHFHHSSDTSFASIREVPAFHHSEPLTSRSPSDAMSAQEKAAPSIVASGASAKMPGTIPTNFAAPSQFTNSAFGSGGTGNLFSKFPSSNPSDAFGAAAAFGSTAGRAGDNPFSKPFGANTDTKATPFGVGVDKGAKAASKPSSSLAFTASSLQAKATKGLDPASSSFSFAAPAQHTQPSLTAGSTVNPFVATATTAPPEKQENGTGAASTSYSMSLRDKAKLAFSLGARSSSSTSTSTPATPTTVSNPFAAAPKTNSGHLEGAASEGAGTDMSGIADLSALGSGGSQPVFGKASTMASFGSSSATGFGQFSGGSSGFGALAANASSTPAFGTAATTVSSNPFSVLTTKPSVPVFGAASGGNAPSASPFSNPDTSSAPNVAPPSGSFGATAQSSSGIGSGFPTSSSNSSTVTPSATGDEGDTATTVVETEAMSRGEEGASIETGELTSTAAKAAAKAFDTIDTEKSGALATSMLEELVDAVGEGFHGDEFNKVRSLLDPGMLGLIKRLAFVRWYSELVEGSSAIQRGVDGHDDDEEEEVAEEREKARRVFLSVAAAEGSNTSASVSTESFEKLMENLGTTYCEEEHRRTIKKLAKKSGNKETIQLEDFVSWYLEWLFGEEDGDDEDEDDHTEKKDEKRFKETTHTNDSSSRGWGNLFQAKEGSWKCEVCMVQNEADSLRCAACEAPKPGADVGEHVLKNAETVATGLSSIGPGGFSFGSAPVSSGLSSSESPFSDSGAPKGFNFGIDASNVGSKSIFGSTFTFGKNIIAPSKDASQSSKSVSLETPDKVLGAKKKESNTSAYPPMSPTAPTPFSVGLAANVTPKNQAAPTPAIGAIPSSSKTRYPPLSSSPPKPISFPSAGISTKQSSELEISETATDRGLSGSGARRAGIVFDRVDMLKVGKLPVDKFEVLIEELGEGFYGDELKNQRNKIDREGTGFMERAAFVSWYKDLLDDANDRDDESEERTEEAERAKTVFQTTAGELKNVIPKNKFGELMEAMGTTYCEEEHTRTIKRLSTPDGTIHAEDFVNWYLEWLFGDGDNDEGSDNKEGNESIEGTDRAAPPKSDPKATDNVGWGNLFKLASGSWQCAVCMVQNKADATQCAACETVRPGFEAEARPEPAAAPSGGGGGGFTSGTIGASSGFDFGSHKASTATSGLSFGGPSGFSFGAKAPTASKGLNINSVTSGFQFNGSGSSPAPAATADASGPTSKDTPQHQSTKEKSKSSSAYPPMSSIAPKPFGTPATKETSSGYPPMSSVAPKPFLAAPKEASKSSSAYPPMSAAAPTPFGNSVSKVGSSSAYPPISAVAPKPFGGLSAKEASSSSYPPMSAVAPKAFGVASTKETSKSSSGYPPISSTAPKPFCTSVVKEVSSLAYPPMSSVAPKPSAASATKETSKSPSSYPPTAPTPFGSPVSKVASSSAYPPMSAVAPKPFGAPSTKEASKSTSSYPPMSSTAPKSFSTAVTKLASSSYPPMSAVAPKPFVAGGVTKSAAPLSSKPGAVPASKSIGRAEETLASGSALKKGLSATATPFLPKSVRSQASLEEKSDYGEQSETDSQVVASEYQTQLVEIFSQFRQSMSTMRNRGGFFRGEMSSLEFEASLEKMVERREVLRSGLHSLERHLRSQKHRVALLNGRKDNISKQVHESRQLIEEQDPSRMESESLEHIRNLPLDAESEQRRRDLTSGAARIQKALGTAHERLLLVERITRAGESGVMEEPREHDRAAGLGALFSPSKQLDGAIDANTALFDALKTSYERTRHFDGNTDRLQNRVDDLLNTGLASSNLTTKSTKQGASEKVSKFSLSASPNSNSRLLTLRQGNHGISRHESGRLKHFFRSLSESQPVSRVVKLPSSARGRVQQADSPRGVFRRTTRRSATAGAVDRQSIPPVNVKPTIASRSKSLFISPPVVARPGWDEDVDVDQSSIRRVEIPVPSALERVERASAARDALATFGTTPEKSKLAFDTRRGAVPTKLSAVSSANIVDKYIEPRDKLPLDGRKGGQQKGNVFTGLAALPAAADTSSPLKGLPTETKSAEEPKAEMARDRTGLTSQKMDRKAEVGGFGNLAGLSNALSASTEDPVAPESQGAAGPESAVDSLKANAPDASSSHRAVYAEFFKQYKPSKASDVDNILAKVKGKEEDALAKLAKKWGVPNPYAKLSAVPSTSLETPAGSSTRQTGPPTPPSVEPSSPIKPPHGSVSSLMPVQGMNLPEQSEPRLTPDYRLLLTKFYETYNPAKIGDVEKSLEKYKGKEEEMFEKLAKKYNRPNPLTGSSSNDPSMQRDGTISSSTVASESVGSVVSGNTFPTGGLFGDKMTETNSLGTSSTLAFPAAKPSFGGETPFSLPNQDKIVPSAEPTAPSFTQGMSQSNAVASTPFAVSSSSVGTFGQGARPIPFGGSLGSTTNPGGPSAASFGGKSPRELLISFYQQYNAAKVAEVDKLLLKYAGREEHMFRNLAQKYNLDPSMFGLPSVPLVAPASSASSFRAAAPASSAASGFGQTSSLGSGSFGFGGVAPSPTPFGSPSALGGGSSSTFGSSTVPGGGVFGASSGAGGSTMGFGSIAQSQASNFGSLAAGGSLPAAGGFGGVPPGAGFGAFSGGSNFGTSSFGGSSGLGKGSPFGAPRR